MLALEMNCRNINFSGVVILQLQMCFSKYCETSLPLQEGASGDEGTFQA